jgi:protein O-GlcNAc transferase
MTMQTIEHGRMLHGQGRVAEAERVYRAVLAQNPRQFDALHLLALLRYQQGHFRDAHELIAKALELKPRSPQALSVMMAALLALDRPADALAVCDRILAINPRDLDTLYNRAVVLSQLRRFEEALVVYNKVLAREPRAATVLFDRGNVLAELARFEDASASYDKVLAGDPGHVGALINRGNVSIKLGRYQEALASYDRGLAIKADDINALSNRAIALKELRRYDEAMASCEKALTIDPNAIGALVTRGNVLIELKRYEEALASFQRALAIRPGDLDALNNSGVALTHMQRFGEALACFDRALAIDPIQAGVLDSRGVALFAIGRFEDALASYDRALAIEADHAEALYHRGLALANLWRYDEAIAAWQRALTIDPRHPHAFGALAFYQLMVCNWTETERIAAELERVLAEQSAVLEPFTLLAYSVAPAEQLRHTRRYVRDRMPTISQSWPVRMRQPSDKIRVAYLSSSFQRHPTGWQIAELFELHDRARFEVLGVSYGADDGSDIRARLVKAFDQFHDVTLRGDREVAQLLFDLGIDIAVDLKGHTEQARPWILAGRPAPIQVSYFGYTATMGVDFIDYVLADRIVLPFDQQDHYSEKIVHIPDCYWVNDSKRQVADEVPSRHSVGLPEDGFVFCCFNNSYKLTPPLFDVWMRLLRQVEGSVLWLLQTSDVGVRNLRSEAQARGIDPARLIFAPKMEISRHLARHRLADLFLDNLPVNAHTAASDALWVGLPVLTCPGHSFIGRVAASLLHAIGLPELVTASLDEYEALALRLARDREALQAIRRRLEANRNTYPLFDTHRLRRHIEAAYSTMWEICQRGESPRSFAVGSTPNAG